MLKTLLICDAAALAIGFAADFLLGDPRSLPHPVVGMGRLITLCEKRLRRGGRGDLGRGALTAVTVAGLSTLLPAAVLALAWRIRPAVYLVLESLMCYQLLAARDLVRESRAVQRALKRGDTEGARRAVSMIVGRDTERLDRDGICRAAVETVAENTSDGVIAPLFWMGLFGAAGGFFYKSVNTMDSMIGYKNEKYLFFGRAAAKLDDAVNFLPARLSALLMIAVCPLLGLDAGGALRIFRRDRRKHESPNSAQTESVCAGALGLRLAGDAFYGGVLHKKPFIGDPARMIEPRDIERAGRLMYMASFAMLLLVTILRGAVIVCI